MLSFDVLVMPQVVLVTAKMRWHRQREGLERDVSEHGRCLMGRRQYKSNGGARAWKLGDDGKVERGRSSRGTEGGVASTQCAL